MCICVNVYDKIHICMYEEGERFSSICLESEPILNTKFLATSSMSSLIVLKVNTLP